MDSKMILHILRNPFSWVPSEVRQAEKDAADLIESLQQQNKAMLELLKEFTFYIKGMRSCINVNDNDKYKLNQIIESNLKLIAEIEGQNDQL